MELTDILVHLDHHLSSEARLEVAVDLARRHQARLTGLMLIRHQYPTEAAVLAAQELFEQMVAQAGIEGRWQCLDGSGLVPGMIEMILAQAHGTDLLVIGQGSTDSANLGVPFDLPEGLVLESGLPVLIVPYAGRFSSVGERVLVAWKAGRESTRALQDALPILKRARSVELMVKHGLDMGGVEGEDLTARIRAHLARHGVIAHSNWLPTGPIPLGDVLLNRACDAGFDLLVVGAYATGKGGKPELGSVARHLLREMTVPVLMSH